MIDAFNTFFWVGSNILVGYIAVVLVVFALAYPILFDPRATTAGKLILRFVTSLIGVMSLVAISVFIDPRAGGEWFMYPPAIADWRPIVRFAAYAYVSYAMTSLVVLLWYRKFRPQKIQTAPNETTIPVVVRNKKENT